MREQMFLLAVTLAGICIIVFLLVVSYFIRRVAPEDPTAGVKRHLDVSPVVAAILKTYRETGSRLLSTCPFCDEPVVLKIKDSQGLIRLSCRCGACDGTYEVSSSAIQQNAKA